jgi:hypothetical protein
MQLKDEIVFKNENNRWMREQLILDMDDKFVKYESRIMNKPRISSHTLVDLVGLNKWTTPGKTLLTIFGGVKREQIDPYQIHKGGIAEEFAKQYLMNKFGAKADIEAFTVSQFPNFNQFPDAFPFSGVLDLMVHKPLKMSVEVKSKEMREYENIAIHGNYPRDQVLQGANQAILAGTNQYMMLWVFLKPSTSKLLKELNKPITLNIKGRKVETSLWIWGDNYEKAVKDLELTYDDFLFYGKEFEADIRLVNAYREKALALYNEFYENRRIDRKLFSASERKIIKDFIERTKA